ncbi:class I SAM-dependent methyltransferase [Lutibacter sp.]
MNEYFRGKKLIGEDFSIRQIKKWYRQEEEGYAELGAKNRDVYQYNYHTMNRMHGFDKIKTLNFENVLGMGSAYGDEFLPIISKISNLTIVEPSDSLVNTKIGSLTPSYLKPNEEGKLSLEDNTFDLITCFGTLHHIPNVSFVLAEMIRVLKPDGYLLIREPIRSMGDWRYPRNGLTKNERGIYVSFFDSVFEKYTVAIESKEFCFSGTSFLQRKFGKFFKKPIYSYKYYCLFDKYISSLLKNNVQYHSERLIHKIGPSSIFYVVKKNNSI